MILVIGKTGQLATELGLLEGTELAGRDRAELTNPTACAALISDLKPSAVINAAAYTAVDLAEEEEPLAHAINAAAPGAMAAACAGLDIPFINVSTDYVFDGTGEMPRRPNDPTGPLGAYGRTKLLGEQAVQAAGGRAVSLRTSWVFSAHGNNFVKTMLRLSETRPELRVVADQFGGPTSAASIAAACLRIAKKLTAESGPFDAVYHFAGAPAVSWAEFAEEIFTATGKPTTVEPIPTKDYPTPAARPGNSRLDCASFERDFQMSVPDWRRDLRDVLKQLGAHHD